MANASPPLHLWGNIGLSAILGMKGRVSMETEMKRLSCVGQWGGRGKRVAVLRSAVMTTVPDWGRGLSV